MSTILTGAHQLSWETSMTQEELFLRTKIAKELGCGVFEVFLSGDFGSPLDIREATQRANLTAIGLAIIRDGIDGDPLSTDEKTRGQAETAIEQYIEQTHDMGGSLLVGPLANVLGKSDAHCPTETEIDAGVRTFRHIVRTASPMDVRVAIEPLQWTEIPWPNTVEQVLSFIHRVEEPSDVPKGTLGVLFDIYHALRMEENWVTALKMVLAAEKLFHVHVAGPNRTPPRMDQHIDWKTMISILKGAGWNGTVAIESFGKECDLPFVVVGPGERPPAEEVISIGVETLQKAGL